MRSWWARVLAASSGFNEAAGADPADARQEVVEGGPGEAASMRPRGQTPRMLTHPGTGMRAHTCFNEAAGADPADASARS